MTVSFSLYVSSSESLVMFTGFLILSLLSFIPFLNCLEMLTNANLYFWIGPGVPWGMMASCFMLLLGWLVASNILFMKKAGTDNSILDPAWANDHSVFVLFRSFIALFAVGLLLQSFPLSQNSEEASHLLLNECGYDRQSNSLQNQYQQLRAMRQSDACAIQRSVELCEGFAPNDYTDFLKWVENEFQCTGMCAEPSVLTTIPTIPEEPEEEEEDLVADVVITTPEPLETLVSPANLDAVGATFIEIRRHNEKGSKKVVKKVKTEQVPNPGNALFSSNTYNHHCAHMVASDLKNQGAEMSRSSFVQGALLLSLTIVSCFVELVQNDGK